MNRIAEKIAFSSKKSIEEDIADTNLENLYWEHYQNLEPLDKIEVSLLKADGSDTGYGSGVNWGIRKNGYKRNRNQAYWMIKFRRFRKFGGYSQFY